VVYIGIALFLSGMELFRLWLTKIGLVIMAAIVIVIGGVISMIGILTYKRGFDELSVLDPAKYKLGSTGSLLLLIGVILIIVVITAPIGLLLAWLGILLTGIVLIRIGEETGSTFLVISSVLFIIPFLNWLGAILLYFALEDAIAKISTQVTQTASPQA
jgi:multisubunit Na+/H+ antiporter MnhG subunit